jgi:hypothetical protein
MFHQFCPVIAELKLFFIASLEETQNIKDRVERYKHVKNISPYISILFCIYACVLFLPGR